MTILVTGAGGSIGGRVVATLVAAGVAVRATTRSAVDIEVPDGVETTLLDLTAPHPDPAVLQGVEAAFLYPVLADPSRFLAAARSAGVGYFVLLSSPASFSPGEHDQPIGQVHRAMESALDAAGVPYTVVYPSWLASNATRDWASQITSRAQVALESPDAHVAPIHPADVAAVAADLLMRPDFRGRLQVLSGPASLTLREVVQLIGAEIGHALHVAELSRSEALAARPPHLPAEIYQTLLEVEAGSVGVPALLTNGVERILGRAPRPMSAWVHEHRADFLGSSPTLS